MSDTVMIAVFAVSAVIMVIVKKISGSRRPVRSALVSMLCGLVSLCAVNLFSPLTSVSLPVSRLSLLVSAILGIPGVTAMLLLQMIL